MSPNMKTLKNRYLIFTKVNLPEYKHVEKYLLNKL